MIDKNASIPDERVIWLRTQANWTQAQAAAEVGVSAQTFMRWENGRIAIPLRKLGILEAKAGHFLKDIPKSLVQPPQPAQGTAASLKRAGENAWFLTPAGIAARLKLRPEVQAAISTRLAAEVAPQGESKAATDDPSALTSEQAKAAALKQELADSIKMREDWMKREGADLV